MRETTKKGSLDMNDLIYNCNNYIFLNNLVNKIRHTKISTKNNLLSVLRTFVWFSLAETSWNSIDF